MNTESIVIMSIVTVLAAGLGYFISRSKAANAISRLQLHNDQQQLALTELEKTHTDRLQKIESISRELTESEKAQALAEQQANSLTEQLRNSEETISQAQGKIEQLQASLSEKEQAYSSAQASLHSEQQQAVKRNEELENLSNELKLAHETLSHLKSDNAKLLTAQEKVEEHHQQQLAQFEEQKAALKTEFENLANQIFETKSQAFTTKNRASLEELLTPFKTQMNDFKQKVESIHTEDTKQQTELKTELKQLQELNKQITEEAHHLATALKGQKKMQGNWGEMILENILDRSGLVQGKDYKREVSINTEEGRGRPDAIVYLPEDKELIIDSKVSLNAYTRYVNAEDELERQQALKEHVDAVAKHIRTLSERDYANLPGINSPEMVFMFIPIESAYVEAIKADETLFQHALEQKVLVATPTTLLTSLNIVRQLWRYENQNKHTAQLADKAGKLYDKLRNFVGSMEGVGNALDRAKTSYDKAYGQLTNGRGNLIKQASEFKQLGVSIKSELPKHLVEKAELELNHQQLLEDNQAEDNSDDVIEATPHQLEEVI